MMMTQRQSGTSDLRISPVALGCWPLAGITSGGMTDEAAVTVIGSALEAFQAECPIAACQVRYNWLQREIEAEVLPWCRAHQVNVIAYEPLALGLLTGTSASDK